MEFRTITINYTWLLKDADLKTIAINCDWPLKNEILQLIDSSRMGLYN